ncbi:MAG TPA: biopolymer transporter ExbD [Elusimicrobiota bacterium]|nr:biopolymer transporter ExbD [Elusimicrobiota bacterium]
MHSSDESDVAITGINVTPLVDVLLVVLIIFMATAPILARRAIKLDLPKAALHEKMATDALSVALDAKHQLTLSGKPVTPEQLKRALTVAVSANAGQPVSVSADRGLSYGDVAALLDDIRSAGVRKVGLEVVRK